MMKWLQVTFILISVFSGSLVFASRLDADPGLAHDTDGVPGMSGEPTVPPSRPSTPEPNGAKEDVRVRMMRALYECINRPGTGGAPGSIPPVQPPIARQPSNTENGSVPKGFEGRAAFLNHP